MTCSIETVSPTRLLRLHALPSSQWLDLCLQAHEQRKLSAAGCLPLAAVAGADSADERGRSAKAAAAAAPDATAGFALCGFGTGEAPEERPALLAASVAHLPANKVRFVSGLTTPWEVLDAVAEGIDLFDTSYVARATSLGYALRFPLQPPPPLPSAAANGGGGGGGGHADGDGPQAAAAAAATASSSSSSTDGAADPGLGQDASKMNLWSAAYRLDKGPLVAGCTCLACRNHTRAYIHHLLHVHEMLADVLLEAHNTHHYQLLMENVKRAIAEGRFEQFRGWFRGVVGGAAAEAAWVPPASVRTGRTGKTGEAVDGGAGADDAAEHLSIGDAMEAEGCLIGAGGGRDATAQAAARGAKRVRHTSLDEQ